MIIVNDCSSDNSAELAEKFLSAKNIDFKIIKHIKNRGLAAAYNTGIKAARGELLIFAHQDIELYKDAFKNLLEPLKDNDIIGAYHYTYQSLAVWQKYNFWQKYFFCRWVNKKAYGMNGKFDAFRRITLLAIGLFDEKKFKSAGEDADLLVRLQGKGKIVKTEAGILHLHDEKPGFNIFDIIKKQAQLSEAQGALFRKHCWQLGNIFGLAKNFFREILLLGLCLPIINFFSLALIIFYCFFVSRVMFIYEYKNWRAYLLPLLNFSLFFVSLIFSIRGFVTGKQTYH